MPNEVFYTFAKIHKTDYCRQAIYIRVWWSQAPHFIQEKAQKQALYFKDTKDEISFHQKIKLPW